MRILHWLNTFLPDLGGIQTFCADLVPELMDRGHDVLLLTAHSQAGLPDSSMHGRIDVRRVDSLRALHRRDPGDLLRAKLAIARVIQEFDPDVIHLHPCGPEVPFFLQLQKQRPTPTVITLHNNHSTARTGFGPESTVGRAFSLAGRVASVSEDAHTWLASIRPDLLARMSTVHNGIPAGAATPPPLPFDPPTLLFVGRIEPQKRLDVGLRAFATVCEHHADVRFRVAGNGSELESMVELATTLGIDHRVDFLGRVDPTEIDGILDETTIFFMSSDYEGLPIALLEAARKARPTVSTDAGGVREVVLDGRTGLLAPTDQPDALATAVLSLLTDRDRATRMGIAARRHFDDGFALDACASAYERLYDEVLAEGPLTDDSPA